MATFHDSVPIVRETLLSRRPRQSSRLVTALSIGVLFLTSIAYWEDIFHLSADLVAIPERVFDHHEYWRLFTAMFIHSDMDHFSGNAISLALFAYLVYGYFGLWVFPLGALLLGALANLCSLFTYPSDAHLLGASGLVYVLAGFWIILYLLVDRRFSLASRALRTLGFALALLVPSTIHMGVSYRTHGFGFVLGAGFGAVYFFLNRRKIRQAERLEYEPTEFIEA